jgi:hypothetical protein
MTIKDRILQQLNEGADVAATKVGKVISDNTKKTKKMGGKVELSIMRKTTVIAFIGTEHIFNASLKNNGSWSVGNSDMKGAPASVIGSKKSFDDATAAKALQSLFDAA